MKLLRPVVLCLPLLSGLSGVAFAAPGPAPAKDLLAGFDAQVARAVRDWRAPGFAIAVIQDGKLIFSRGYGVREVGRPEIVDTRTLFAIGSTTKAMTAAAIGMLIDEKKVAWDDPVTKHLPWFELKEPYLTREITVRDLLTHRAGLPNADFLWYGQQNATRSILEKMRLVAPAYSTRSSFIYQNVMYAAAGAVVEAASGVPWSRFVEERIFKPLQMTDSTTSAATLTAGTNRASPHFIVDGAVTRIDNVSVEGVAAAGSIWSSVDDMSKWVRLLLAGGVVSHNGADKRLLSEASLAELFKPQTMVTPEAFYPTARITKPDWTTYGLGWSQQNYAGLKVDYHTGSIDGMVAICGLIRSRGIGVYILSNLDHAELRHALMYAVFDRLLERPARDWSWEFRTLYAQIQKDGQEAQKKEAQKRRPGTKPSLPLAEYAGRYSDPLFGDVEVALLPDGSALRARYGSAFSGRLEHWNFDTFNAVWDAHWRGEARLSFRLDQNGRVSEIDLMGLQFRKQHEPPT